MSTGPVVVGIDGSASSKTALRWAEQYARAYGTDLVAVMAWDIGLNYGYPVLVEDSDYEDFTTHTRTMLRDSVGEVLGVDAKVEERIERGHPAAVLLEAAAEASLLVVGTRGHGAFAGMLLGSVSQHCVAHAPCPVVVVPHAEPDN